MLRDPSSLTVAHDGLGRSSASSGWPFIPAHKEMIATLVSVQNVCPYCADSHGYHLRMNGSSREILCAVQTNNLLFPSLTEPEQALLGFAQKLNRSSHEIGRADSEMLGAHRLEQAADR